MNRNRLPLGMLFIALVAASAQVARGAGACCIGGICSEPSKQDCVNGGGVFQGDGSVCTDEDDPTDNLCAVVFVQHDISTIAGGASSVLAVDLDGDGDTDVLSASVDDNKIAWYENDGGSPPLFVTHVISISALGVGSVFAEDMDNDGDVDVLSASNNDHKIAWYENDGGSPPTFIAHVVTSRTVAAAALSLAIPDFLSSVSDTLNVSESFLLSDVDIGVQITHDFVGELLIEIEHVGTGIIVTLVSPSGCDEDNYDIILDDEGSGGSIQSQCSADLSSPPNYIPANPLSAFDGLDSAGDWTITVVDTGFSGTGTLDGWSVQLKDPDAGFAENAASVFAADVNGDGNMDILSASAADDRCVDAPFLECTDDLDCGGSVCNVAHALVWYENDGNSTPTFTPRSIPRDRFGKDARFIVAVDLDGDTDIDVLSSSGGEADEDVRAVAWYENDGGIVPVFTEHVVQSTAGARIFSVFAEDIDRDGERDIVSASSSDGAIAWYKNDGGLPPVFAQQTVSGGTLTHFSIFAADIDGDGDSDVVSGSYSDTESWIGWYENRGGSPPSFSARTRRISNDVVTTRAVFAVDLDGDGDIDILSASAGDNKIAWYENQTALDVFNVTTDELFATVASAVANATNGDVLRAAPARFDAAEPTIDFLGRAITLQARGEVTQPLGGTYTLADDSTLRTAPGNWDMMFNGALVVPAGARADLFAASFSFLGAGSSLTADPNAVLGLSADVTIDGTISLDFGSVLMTPGTLDLTSSSTLTVDGGEIIAAGGITIAGDATLGTGSALRTNGALSTAAGSTLTMSGSELVADGTVTLQGNMDLNTGSLIHAGELLIVAMTGTLTATGSDLQVTGDITLNGPADLSLGSTLTAGGGLVLNDNGIASLTMDGVELFVAGTVKLNGPAAFGSGTMLTAGGALEAPQDIGMTSLILGVGTRLSIGGSTTMARPLRLNVNSSLSTDSLALQPTSELILDANASISAVGNIDLDAPVTLSVNSLLAAEGAIVNASQLQFFGAGIVAGGGFENTDSLTGFGTIDAAFFNDTLANAVFQADTEVLGDYTNGTLDGQCDDANPNTAGQSCTGDAECGGVGVCEATLECDQAATFPEAICVVDADCSPGLCVADNKCSADSDGGLAQTPCGSDSDCRIGICLNAVTTVEQNATLIILGTLTNHGTMNGPGTIQPAPLAGFGGATSSSTPSHGLVIRGDLVAGPNASLFLPETDSVVEVGGSFDSSITDNVRVDLARAELRMSGSTGNIQELEMMSRDIGPSPFGLRRSYPAHFPIGRLRIGPMPTTVRIVNNVVNDQLGQPALETLYVRDLVIEVGATLNTGTYTVYYGTMELNGAVDNSENLVQIIPWQQDLDRDFDVDLLDFAPLSECVSGPGNHRASDSCTKKRFTLTDFDGDGDVDLFDLRLFQNAFTGE